MVGFGFEVEGLTRVDVECATGEVDNPSSRNRVQGVGDVKRRALHRFPSILRFFKAETCQLHFLKGHDLMP